MASIETYHIPTAIVLLGPADFGTSRPIGCLNHTALILNRIAIFLFRLFNLICGDHKWYSNDTARQIVEQYAVAPQPNTSLDRQMRQLYSALLLRANGDVSCAHGIDTHFLQYHQNSIRFEIPLIEDASLDAAADTLADDAPLEMPLPLPIEILIKGILPQCDESSLVQLLSTNKAFRGMIKGEAKLYKDLLLQFALKKALRVANERLLTDKIYVLCEFAKLQAADHPEQAKILLEEALEISNTLDDTEEFYDVANQTCNSKSTGLLLVASAQAFIDPEMAIATANLSRHHASALAEIAKTQALTNTETALQTITSTRRTFAGMFGLKFILTLQGVANPESILATLDNMLPGEVCASTKLIVLQEIAQGIAITDPQKAIEIAELIHASERKDAVFEWMAVALASTCSAQAIAVANRIGNLIIKEQTLFKISFQQASTNSASALGTVDLIENDEMKAIALCGIAHQLTLTDLVQAQELSIRAFNLAHDFDPSRRDPVFCAIAGVQAMINVDQAKATVNLIQDPSWNARALCRMADSLSSTDLAQTKELCLSALDVVYSANVNCDKALAAIAQTQALYDIEAAERTANGIVQPEMNQSTLEKIIQIQTGILLGKARTTAAALPVEKSKHHALINIIKAEVLDGYTMTKLDYSADSVEQEYDFPLPDPALETLRLIEDPVAKNRACREIVIARALQSCEDDHSRFCVNKSYYIHQSIKGEALCKILQARVLARPRQANELFLQGLMQASLLTDEEDQIITFVKIAQILTTVL